MSHSVRKIALAFGVTLLAAMMCWSSVVETTVKYISPPTVYLSAGSAEGVQKGDSADVLRDGQAIARLQIVYVAASSSSAQILQSSLEPRIGDHVRIMISTLPLADSSRSEIAAADTSQAGIYAAERSPGASGLHPATRIYGRMAAQIIYQDDREAANHDVTKPALVLRATVEDILVSHLSLAVNLRARRIISSSGAAGNQPSDWDNRIYEIALHYDNPASALNYQAGRISSNRINGIGIFDGALIEYRMPNGWSAGAFGGSRPDYGMSSFNTDQPTGGLYAAYETDVRADQTVRGTLALVGRYHLSEIDREFIYEQMNYTWSRRLLITQSADIAINRGWRRQAEGSAWGWSNVLINAGYSPVNAITFDLGYDNRKLARSYETKNTPDSLFDDALRQGFRAGVSARGPFDVRARLRVGLRIRATNETDTRTLTTSLSRNNIANSGVSASVQYDRFENRLSSGDQISLTLARYFLRVLYLQFDLGNSKYKISTGDSKVNYRWFNLAGSGNLTRHVYASAYGEIYRGDGMDTNRLGLELGYRF